MGWLLVLGLKKSLVECATVCIKNEVILIFIVPYTIMLFLVGIPIMIVETCLGQFYNLGANKVINNFLSLFFDTYKDFHKYENKMKYHYGFFI